MLTGSILILVLLLTYCLYRRLKRNHMVGWRKQRPAEDTTAFPRHPPKPAWVRQEIIRLKALMPHDGCRTSD